MHYNVPQFIDIEDRIVGPLTAKQLLWLFAMAATLFVVWFVLENKLSFFITAIPIGVIFLAFAFYRPYGYPLSKFVGSMFFFFVKPKVYVWNRNAKPSNEKETYKREVAGKAIERKILRQKEIYDISKILDSEPDILKEINKKD
ncbi:MAG: hypothetical protein UR66_C0001G0040 [Candidatus Moranbacteria bacterium GW2011_GWE1_35_17]|nr:MAG: hypothetical protein UR66_C0001G0040 [Candidatus Moranbacteria bacterium GW2011_GWE1_35_17]KKP71758.1 MAG: hypothetical protein UR65_C0027G0009 [Candidatus Moranbacteria bacterium GW2011_GWE2_35_164]KKP83384.1 MAG: hypothetical protein UR82_C0021G0014 [Candidatus Moranbacteria bacterium GW2011_GWF1_35_5]KKP84672.1 MAG: hypothetical protein UR83_C0016G0012 [Candidatus Moranbacteria bacterium GW2011_GWF2_35_54]